MQGGFGCVEGMVAIGPLEGVTADYYVHPFYVPAACIDGRLHPRLTGEHGLVEVGGSL